MKKNIASKVQRNPVAMHMKQRSKKIPHRNERRSKDARRSWKNEEV